MQHWFVIINPKSGLGRSEKRWREMKDELSKRDISHTHVFTTAETRGDALVQVAIAKGERHILCIGGDGHLNDVLNGLMQQANCVSTEVTIAFLSCGTGNDLIRTLGIPTSASAVADMMLHDKKLLMDVGCAASMCEGREVMHYFHDSAGVGFDAYVVEHTLSFKRFGALAYLFGMLKSLFTYRKPILRIEHDEGALEARVYLALAGNGKFGGGGMKLMPDAVIDDGYFHVSVAKDFSIPEVIWHTPKLYSGAWTRLEKVEVIRTKELRISVMEAAQIVRMEADGELLGEAPFHITLLPRAFCILVP